MASTVIENPYEPAWLHDPESLPEVIEETKSTDKVFNSNEKIKLNKIKSLNERSSLLKHPTPEIYVSNSHIDEESYICCLKYDPVIISFYLFHLLATLTSIASVTANIYVFTDKDEVVDIRNIILRIYAILFAICIVLIESELRIIMRLVLILESWFFKGLLYILVGLITTRKNSSIKKFENIAGIAMIAFGLIYLVMALLCIKSLKLRHINKMNLIR